MIDYTAIHPSIMAGIRRYADHHVEPGGFLRAVFANNLSEALGRADEQSLATLHSIVAYLDNKCPGDCWGVLIRLTPTTTTGRRP